MAVALCVYEMLEWNGLTGTPAAPLLFLYIYIHVTAMKLKSNCLFIMRARFQFHFPRVSHYIVHSRMRHWHIKTISIVFHVYYMIYIWLKNRNALVARMRPRCHTHTRTHFKKSKWIESISYGFSILFDFEATIKYLNPNAKWQAKAVNLFRINLHDGYLGVRHQLTHISRTHLFYVLREKFLLFVNWINLQLQYGVLLSRVYLPSGDKDLNAYTAWSMMHTA